MGGLGWKRYERKLKAKPCNFCAYGSWNELLLSHKIVVNLQTIDWESGFLRSKINGKQKGYLKIAGNIMKQIAAKKNKTLWRVK